MVLDFYCLNKACFLSVTLAELAASTGLPHTPNSTLRFLHLCNSTASFAPSAANICLRRNCFYKKKSVQSAFGSFKASCFKYYLSLAHHPPAPLPHINTLTYISPPPIPPNQIIPIFRQKFHLAPISVAIPTHLKISKIINSFY